MRIFQSDDCILFGEPLPVPMGRRPKQAQFTHGRTRAGFNFAIRWRRVPGAMGYHIFRSLSVATIRERSLEKLWKGSYSSEVRHFTLSYPDVGTVVDDYGSRGAAMMYYWVLAQLAGGHLRVVEELSVGMADMQVLDEPHFLLRPGGGFVEGAEQAAAAHVPPLPQPDPDPEPEPAPTAPPARMSQPPRPPKSGRRSRPVEFSRYIAPGGFRFVGVPKNVDHISVYVGAERPDEQDEAAMWQDIVYESNPMEQFRLPPRYTGFRDDIHDADSVAYAAAFAFTRDRRVKQLDIALSHDIERVAVLR